MNHSCSVFRSRAAAAGFATGALLLVTALTAAFTCGVSVGSTRGASTPRTDMQQGLQRIIQIRRQQVDRFRATQFTSHELAYVKNPQFDLLEAEAELASARGNEESSKGKRREIVSLRQQFVREMQQRGDIAPTIREEALVDLYEAQFELAQAEGKPALAEQNLSRIIGVRRQRMERVQDLQRRQANGPQGDLVGEKAEILYLEAKVRLARFQFAAQQQVATRPAEPAATQQK